MIDIAYYLALCEDAQKNMDSYKSDAEAMVVKWEYAKYKRHDLTPYYFERNHESRGSISKHEEETAYGLDEKGEIWITKDDFFRESIGFYSRNERQLINRLYIRGKLDSIEEISFEAGVPIHYLKFIVRNGMTVEDAWYSEEWYEYENHNLVKIIQVQYWSQTIEASHQQYDMAYNEKGKLSQIKNKRNQTIYFNIPKTQLVALREEVKAELIHETHQVLQTIGEKAGAEKFCYIGIYLHDEPTGVCDPIFHPALERIRADQLNTNSKLDLIWNTGEHPVDHQETIQSKEVLEKYERLVQCWEVKDGWWKEAKKLWYEITMELNQAGWSKYSFLTDDFVLFVDEERFKMKDLAKSIPQEKLDMLRSRGLLSH